MRATTIVTSGGAAIPTLSDRAFLALAVLLVLIAGWRIRPAPFRV